MFYDAAIDSVSLTAASFNGLGVFHSGVEILEKGTFSEAESYAASQDLLANAAWFCRTITL